MNLAWYMARRLYSHGGDVKRVSRPAIRIATLGVLLGVAVMVVSVCIVLGFKGEVQQKVMGMGSHIQVYNQQNKDNIEKLPILLTDSMLKVMNNVEGVEHVQRFCDQPGMLKTEESFQGVLLKGVGPEYDTRFLREHLVAGSLWEFNDTVRTDNILISETLANELKLSVGNRVYAYFFDGQVRPRRFSVCGIYSTHINEFDKSFIFTDLYTTHQLAGFAPEHYSGAEIIVSDLEILQDIADRVDGQVKQFTNDCEGGYIALPITKLYPGIFSWLSLLDTNIWVILGLMMAVAVFTMISGLLIIILERTQFIGTMKALGATNGRLRQLFLYFSIFIILKGIFIGDVLALLLVYAQQFFGFVKLDGSTYYVDVLPVHINWLYIALINVGTLLVSFLVLIVPSYLVSRIHPARSIRFE